MMGLRLPVTRVVRRHAALIADCPETLRRRGRQGPDIDRHGVGRSRSRIESRQPQQVVDKPAQVPRLLVDALEGLGVGRRVSRGPEGQ